MTDKEAVDVFVGLVEELLRRVVLCNHGERCCMACTASAPADDFLHDDGCPVTLIAAVVCSYRENE